MRGDFDWDYIGSVNGFGKIVIFSIWILTIHGLMSFSSLVSFSISLFWDLNFALYVYFDFLVISIYLFTLKLLWLMCVHDLLFYMLVDDIQKAIGFCMSILYLVTLLTSLYGFRRFHTNFQRKKTTIQLCRL